MKKYIVISVVLITALFTTALAENDLRESLYQHVSYLADDAREGRGIGTQGLDDAADYIAEQFKALGLEPAFGESYFQPFEMGWGVELGPNNFLTVGETVLDTSAGIMPIGFSSADSVTGRIVFVGYGITAPEYEYDDYEDIDVEGAVVLVLRYEPGQFDTASVFDGVNYSTHSSLRSKASNAKHHGAAGLIIVEGPMWADNPDDPEYLVPPRTDEPYLDCGMPAFWMTREGMKTAFPDFELGKLQRSIDTNTQPRSLDITSSMEAITITLQSDLTREYVTVKNVGGVLTGSDEIIVVGAHYDHLGYGQSGSLDEKENVIHNGADDNASGVAGVLGAAQLLTADPVSATVLFVAFTAEEVGLGGSSHLVKNFPWDVEQVRTMINLDMIGRVAEDKLVLQACKSAAEFTDIVETANQDVGLEIICKGDGYGPSDHMNFYLEERPVLYLFTGAHEDYHKSTDDTEKINFDGVVQCTQLTANLVTAIDEYREPLTYVKSEEPQSQGGGRFRVSFGSIPDYAQADSLIGVLLSGAREGGPAHKAGLRGGDLLTKMGDVILNNIYDLMFALKTYAPGDSVEVLYTRDGEELSTNAVLIAPKKN
jgi:hypothetical protein